MGRRTRKKRVPREERVAATPDSAIKRGYARGEERNQRIREELEPLAPGERPQAVTIAAIVALVLAVANTVAIAFGDSFESGALVSNASFTVILLVAAAGMWKAKYWAVLGFQALLALQVTITTIAALFTLAGLDPIAIPLIVVSFLGGWLFWKLVRALARLQMPDRRPKPPVI